MTIDNEICAYIGKPQKNGMGVDRVIGQSWDVIDWHGKKLGNATCGSRWRVNSYIGTHMYQFYAVIGGVEYTGRGFGEGMFIRLRMTADAKRKIAESV